MSSFFDIGLGTHLGSDNQLMKLDKMLDWSRFSALLRDVLSWTPETGQVAKREFCP